MIINPEPNIPIHIIHRTWRHGVEDIHTVACTRCGFDADSRIHPDWYHRTITHQCAPDSAPHGPAADNAPTLGAQVHYRSYGTPGGEYAPECRAAMITAVDVGHDVSPDAVQTLGADPVALTVFNPDGTFLKNPIYHDENQSGGTWHHPCQ
jgi:hypothetical protein